MKRSIASIVSGIALALVIAVPIPTYASSATFFGPIVPAECHCDNQTVQGASSGASTVNTAPDFGCVLAVIQNLINFGITLSTILFTIYLVLTGFSFITSAGSSEARSKAKTRFTNVFVGLIVLLCAWLIVDFVMKTIYNDKSQFGPWNGILAGKADKSDHCIVARQPTAITAGSIASNITAVAPGTSSGVVSGASGNTKLNTQTAVSFALSNAKGGSGKQCALYVRQALAAGGLHSLDSNHPAYAYQYGPYLQNVGFAQVYSGDYSPSLDGGLAGLQAGDVVVFQPVSGHDAGHIAIYTGNGNQWVSDYVQTHMSSNSSDYNGGSFAIYRP